MSFLTVTGKVLDSAFNTSVYQKIASLGPLRAPELENLANAGSQLVVSVVEFFVPEAAPVVEEVLSPTRLNQYNWTLGANGLIQGPLVCLISLVTTGTFIRIPGTIVGVATGVVWMGIAIRHLSLYSDSEHTQYRKRSQFIQS